MLVAFWRIREYSIWPIENLSYLFGRITKHIFRKDKKGFWILWMYSSSFGCRFSLRHADIISIINIHCCFVLPMSEFWRRNGNNSFISVSLNECVKDVENFAKMHPVTLASNLFWISRSFPFQNILINKRQAQIEGGGRFNFHLKSFQEARDMCSHKWVDLWPPRPSRGHQSLFAGFMFHESR